LAGGVDVDINGESEDFGIYDVRMFKNKYVNLDENEYAYIRKLMEKRFALEKKIFSGSNSLDTERVKILESIATDNTINNKQKEAIFIKYRLLDNIYFHYYDGDLDTTYDTKLKQILNSNIPTAEMLKKVKEQSIIETEKRKKKKK